MFKYTLMTKEIDHHLMNEALRKNSIQQTRIKWFDQFADIFKSTQPSNIYIFKDFLNNLMPTNLMTKAIRIRDVVRANISLSRSCRR